MWVVWDQPAQRRHTDPLRESEMPNTKEPIHPEVAPEVSRPNPEDLYHRTLSSSERPFNNLRTPSERLENLGSQIDRR